MEVAPVTLSGFLGGPPKTRKKYIIDVVEID